jgi:peptidoglycan/LPS O-acetylase OafA/YrhL
MRKTVGRFAWDEGNRAVFSSIPPKFLRQHMSITRSTARLANIPSTLLERLQPAPSGGFYFPQLDGLRALAILWVVVYHAWYVAKNPIIRLQIGAQTLDLTLIFSVGHIGVNLFFVLSGFLLSFPFLNRCYRNQSFSSVRQYFGRRILRIVPAYYAAVLLQVILWPSKSWANALEACKSILGHLTFLFNFFQTMPGTINGAFWTLAIEMQFYLVLPLLMYLVYKRKALFTTGVVVAMAMGWRYRVYRIHSGNDFSMFFYGDQFPYQALQFGVGIMASAVYLHIHHRTNWRERSPRQIAALGLGLSLSGIALVGWLVYRMVHVNFWGGGVDYYLLKIGIALGFGCLLLGALFAPSLAQFVWRNSLARFIGIVSYGMYLWHFPLLYSIGTWGWVSELPAPKQLQVLAVLGTLVSVIVGLFSLILIERPFIQLGHKTRPHPSSTRLGSPTV